MSSPSAHFHYPHIYVDRNIYHWELNAQHNHDTLIQIEKDRRELLRHSKLRYKQYTYFQLWGTVLPLIIISWEWWLSVAIYILARLLVYFEAAPYLTLAVIDSRYLSIIGGFISFLLVFYNNQGYSRYTAQYEQSMRIEGRIFNATYMVKDSLPVGMAWQFIRYLNGVHLLCYIGLSSEYERDNLFIPLNDKLKLFTSVEINRLDEIDMEAGGGCYREVLGWAMRVLHIAKRDGYLDMIQYDRAVSELLQLRGCIGTLYDYEDQPIPFVYVHLVHVITLLYICYFSYFIGTSMNPGKTTSVYSDIAGILALIIFNLIAIGILEIGRLMSQPYLAELSDFSIMHYINFTWTASRRILTGYVFDIHYNEDEERELENGRICMGKGFKCPPATMTPESAGGIGADNAAPGSGSMTVPIMRRMKSEVYHSKFVRDQLPNGNNNGGTTDGATVAGNFDTSSRTTFGDPTLTHIIGKIKDTSNTPIGRDNDSGNSMASDVEQSYRTVELTSTGYSDRSTVMSRHQLHTNGLGASRSYSSIDMGMQQGNNNANHEL